MDAKGKVRRIHRQQDVRTPVDKLRSLPDAASFLRGGVTFDDLDRAASAEVPGRTARRLVAALGDDGILRVMRPGNGRRGAILVFPDLLNIAEGRDVF